MPHREPPGHFNSDAPSDTPEMLFVTHENFIGYY